MTPRSTIAGIAAVLLAAFGAIAPAQQAPPQTDARVPALIASLGGRYGDKAAEELVAIGEPAVAPLLTELRAGGGRAQLACLPLARIGTAPAVDAVIEALHGPDPGVAASAAAALLVVKTARSADALSEALGRADARDFPTMAATGLHSEHDPVADRSGRPRVRLRAANARTDRGGLPRAVVRPDDDPVRPAHSAGPGVRLPLSLTS